MKPFNNNNIIWNTTKTTTTVSTSMTTTSHRRLRPPMDPTVPYPIYIKLTALMNSELSLYKANVRLVCIIMARRAVPLHSVLSQDRPEVSEVTSSRQNSLIDTRLQKMAGGLLITSRMETMVMRKCDLIDTERQVHIKWKVVNML